MKRIKTPLSEVLIIEPDVYRDERGFFLESYRIDKFEELGIGARFVQDNHSKSVKGTLRGLHFQNPHAQGKLVRVTQGEVFDVAVDIRVGSPTFGKWFGTVLNAENMHMMYIPEGFAHGFCVLSDTAEFQYKCTGLYAPDCDRGILWNDPQIGIRWPISDPLLSKKDDMQPRLDDMPRDLLPKYRGQVS